MTWMLPVLLVPSLLVLAVLGLLTGAAGLSPGQVWAALTGAADPVSSAIVWDYRLPRIATALLAGAGLATAGAVMQTLMANPLAGPDVLGVSAGASLGVAVGLLGGVGWGGTGGWSTALWAVAGAAGVMGLLLPASARLSTPALLLVGLMLATAVTGVVSLLQFAAGAEAGRAFLIWTFGSVAGVTWASVPLLAGAVGFGLAVLWSQHRALDLLRLGPLTARSMGVHPGRLRLVLLLGTSVVTGVVTAVCGPIAFVGVAVPHLAAGLSGTAHRRWLPTAAAAGAGVLLGCDVLSQWLPGGRVLPLNAVTAVVGAPVVAWVIIRLYPRA